MHYFLYNSEKILLPNTDLCFHESIKLAPAIRNEADINKGNRIICVHKNGEQELINNYPNYNFYFTGTNALVVIGEDMKFNGGQAILGEGCFLYINGKNSKFRHPVFMDMNAKNVTFFIDEKANIGMVNFSINYDDTEILIGKNFLASNHIVFYSHDGHKIYNKNGNGEPINCPKLGIHIGDNVWCCNKVEILKDTIIQSDCVIGAGSVVTKGNYESNSIICGCPAKIVKRNIYWIE